MNILITGVTGFTGSHLLDRLTENTNNKVFGTVRGKFRDISNISYSKDRVKLLDCDLSDFNSVFATLEDSQPDLIYHLAAQTFVPNSWRAPQETYTTNVIGTLNILEGIRKLNMNPKILIAGSSEEYGMVKEDECPITENNTLNPLSPYAVSKVAQDLMGYQYYYSYGMKIIRSRCFNIIGPRSSDKIFTASFAKQIAQIEHKQLEPTIKVGNLTTIRDLIDVRDVASAYEYAMKYCKFGDVYNITTGNGKKVQDVLDTLITLSTAKDEIKVEHDPERMRPSDVPRLIGDSTKFVNKTGWKPNYTFNESISDVLDYWREVCR